MSAPSVPPRRPLVSVDVLLAGSLRGQAVAIMQWAAALRAAELSGDWAAVQAVREDIAAASQGLACHAIDLEHRAERAR